MTNEATATAGFGALEKFQRRFAKGDRIFEQGDAGATMFFIQEGRVRISRVSAKRTQPLAILEAGAFFGEMAVFTTEPRSARAEAIGDCVLLEIDGTVFNDFLASRTEIALRMIKTLAGRLHDTDALVERLLTGDPVIQVVTTLVELAGDGEGESATIRDVHTLMVRSATDPTLLRWVLGRLKQAGFLKGDDQGIRIVQPERLRQYLNFLRLQHDFLAAQ